ncbi:hypothetical protein [Sediminibacterium sp.]|uniref:hypothetical protein n=1 Tax=Sediminibacterium sp. TaxID=1917865 RepID=UPI003F716A24
MRKILLILSLTVAFSAFGQQPKQQWVTIKSANLKCWECKDKLEKYLIQANKSTMESGLIQWKINLLQGEIKVQFWPDRADASLIKAALNNAGFDADDDKAEPEAYAKLPPICKRAEDGGGPKPPKPCHIPPVQ